MKKIHRRQCLLSLAALLFTAVLWVPPAVAETLDELRAAGVVGERYDGLLVVREGNAPQSVAAMVKEVNAKRSKIYEQRAKQQGVPADQVGRIYAKEIFQKAPKGTWFQGEGGSWTQK
jgi:uncharacterized protein YdbL (DUF1318 family)